MKNSLLIPVVFLANLVIWVCSLSFFSVLGVWRYLDTLSSGNVRLFFVMCAWRAMYLLPVALVLAITVTFLFLMRHRSLPFISIPLVLAIVGASFFFGIPWSYREEAAIETRFPDAIATWGVESPEMVDSGYIRTDSSGAGLKWIDFADSPSSGRKLLRADAAGTDGVLSYTGDALYKRESRSLVSSAGTPIVAAGGTDPLFAANMRLPVFLRPLFADAARVLDSLRSAYRSSFARYLTLAGSFFIAIASLWCLCWASGWRMLNAFLVIAAERVLFFLWPSAEDGLVARVVGKFLPSLPAGTLLPLSFLAIAALLLVGSALVFARRKIRRVKSGAFYE